MENQYDLLRYVITCFERLKIPYFVTGSFASIYYGEYRTTVDIDIVAQVRAEHIAPLVAAFQPPDFYISDDGVRDAVKTRFQFNIIDMSTALKIDVIIESGDEFDLSRRSRVKRIEAAPSLDTWFASPEDVIIKKLLYYQEGGSDKHLRDIAGMLRVSGKTIDQIYIEKWAKNLNVMEIWNTVLKRIEETS